MFATAKKGIKRYISTAVAGIIFTVIGTVGLAMWLSGVTAAVPEVFNGTFMVWGTLCIILAFILEIVISIVYLKKDIKVKYKDVSKFLLSYDERQKLEEEAAKAEA